MLVLKIYFTDSESLSVFNVSDIGLRDVWIFVKTPDGLDWYPLSCILKFDLNYYSEDTL